MSLNAPLFVSAFSVIFIASLPGRTTFLMLLMATRGRGWKVFLGALLAFGIQSVISVALCNLFAFLSPQVIQIGVGFLLLYFAYHFWRDSIRNENFESPLRGNSVRETFLLIFAAETGDVSQVAIASFSARNPERLTVFLSAVCALWLIVGLSIGIGSRLRRSVNPVHIQRIAALGFAASGIFMLARELLGAFS